MIQVVLALALGLADAPASDAQGAPGLRREDLRARRDLVFRVEDRTLYVKRRDGTELALQVSSPGGTAEGEQPPE
jgi:hypothetical protein